METPRSSLDVCFLVLTRTLYRSNSDSSSSISTSSPPGIRSSSRSRSSSRRFGLSPAGDKDKRGRSRGSADLLEDTNPHRPSWLLDPMPPTKVSESYGRVARPPSPEGQGDSMTLAASDIRRIARMDQRPGVDTAFRDGPSRPGRSPSPPSFSTVSRWDNQHRDRTNPMWPNNSLNGGGRAGAQIGAPRSRTRSPPRWAEPRPGSGALPPHHPSFATNHGPPPAFTTGPGPQWGRQNPGQRWAPPFPPMGDWRGPSRGHPPPMLHPPPQLPFPPHPRDYSRSRW